MKHFYFFAIFCLLGVEAHYECKQKDEHEIEKRVYAAQHLWKDGIVPYITDVRFTQEQHGMIAKAIAEYHEKTCIRWVNRINEKDYVFFARADDCGSYIGRQSRMQTINLDNHCFDFITLLHEMMHTIGFAHEHNRPDRDKYVTIMDQNIVPGCRYNFDIVPGNSAVLDYDFKSIMHYAPYDHSKNRTSLPTIVPIDESNVIEMGQTFSELDVKKIRKIYHCDD